MPERICVMISSTARDLPEHRKEVLDACLRQGMFPNMMEHLPASDDLNLKQIQATQMTSFAWRRLKTNDRRPLVIPSTRNRV